ncbi:MAG: efflux RND transporter periplasmic adaptor subunit [Candidatus Krumholzibacteria bacterium]|nr:efflux RND transporter periplasmic adaptor subunit [Candidatus Krumholzibacteria bacterium]
MKKIVIWVVVIVVVAAIVYSRVGNRSNEAPARSIGEIHAAEGVPVDVITVRTGKITVLREITGLVSGIRQSTLRASGDYKIAKVVTREGERVRRGQTLIRYDTAISPDRMARIDQVRESYENAKRQVDRLEPLYKEGAISESDLDAARTALAIAEADLRDARLELAVASPIDGVATLIAVRAGDSVESGDVVAQVAILDSVRIEADVSGEAVRELRSGAQVYLSEFAAVQSAQYEAERADGRITRVSLGANPDTRLFRVEAVLDNADRSLRPGQVVTLEAVVDRVGPVTVMSQLAILGDKAVVPGSVHDVFVVDDGVAVRKSVEIGQSEEDVVEVVSGLANGDKVVVFGANRLKDGMKTKLHKVDGVLIADQNTGAAAGEGVGR